ncbi:hypothetical protein ES708_11946 [subsurface metagenome]
MIKVNEIYARLLKKASDIVSLASRSMAASCVAIMVLVIGFGAIGRYTISKPVPMADELGAYLLVFITFLGASYVLKEKSHITVDFVVRMLSKRVAGWLNVVTDIMSILVTIALIVLTAQVAAGSFRSNLQSYGAFNVPLGPVQLAMPIGLFLLLIVFLDVLSTSIKSGRQPEIQDSVLAQPETRTRIKSVQ